MKNKEINPQQNREEIEQELRDKVIHQDAKHGSEKSIRRWEGEKATALKNVELAEKDLKAAQDKFNEAKANLTDIERKLGLLKGEITLEEVEALEEAEKEKE